MKAVIDACTAILLTNINLLGYDVSLMSVLCLTGCMFLVLRLIFGLFE